MAGSKLRPLDLIIRGVNRVKGPISEVNKQLETMYRPVVKVQRALRSLAREARLPQLGAALSAVGTEFVALAKKAALWASIVGGAALVGMRRFIDYADDIGAAATKIGVSTSALQELRYAGEQLDVEQSTLDASLSRFQKNVVDVGRGTGRAVFAFQALGIRVRGARGQIRPTTDLLEEFADKIARVQDPATRTRYAVAAFGQSGADMLPFLVQGSSEIRRLREEARALGVVLDEKTVRAAGEADNELRRLSYSVRGVGYEIGAAFLPMVTAISEATRGWINENREFLTLTLIPALQATAFTIGQIVTPILKVIATTGGMITVFAAATGWITSKLVGSLFGLGRELLNNPVFMGRVIKVWNAAGTAANFLSTRVLPLLTGALRSVAVAAAANPLGAMIVGAVALVALGVLLYKRFEVVRKTFDAVATGAVRAYRKIRGMLGFGGEEPAAAGAQAGATAGAPGAPGAPARAGAPGPAGPAGEPAAAMFARPPRARDYVSAPAAQQVRGSIGIDIGLARGVTSYVRRVESEPREFGLDLGMTMNGAG